jgi:acyl-CoA synthetase (AMP-forming)/AMP-acid ligase II
MSRETTFTPIIPADPDVFAVHHFLERSAARFPDKAAVVQGKVRAPYGEVNTRANALASYLIAAGVRPGDRVALLLENCPEYVIAYYAILKAGAVAAPLNGDLTPDGLRHALAELEAAVLLSSARYEKVLQAANPGGSGVRELIIKSPRSLKPSSGERITPFDAATDGAPAGNPGVAVSDTDLCSIIYTSGSTGGPKGVMLSHRNIVDNTWSICQYLRLTHDDIQMAVLPFFYVMGKSLLNTHVAVGGTVIINNQFAFPASVLREMIEEKVTGFSGVPSTFAYLLHRSPLAANREKLTALRYVSQAGGHMSRAIKEGLRKVLPESTEIVVMYGATEAAARLSYLEPKDLGRKVESIGKAIPGVTLMVAREDGSEAATGEVGEIVARGSNIMQGYWKNPEATAGALAGGWYHTGDRGYCDDEGFFFVAGRNDDLIKAGGHRVNMREIEDAFLESALLVEAVVVGVPDAMLGNRLVLLAVPAGDDLTSRQLQAFCADRLPKYKVPSEIRLVKSLPKKASGKIDRGGCARLLAQGPAGK